MKKYYVYAYLREDRYTPYYIGKGQGSRIHSKDRNSPPPPKDRKVYIKKNLSEEEALELEEKLILFWGRRLLEDNGVLYNITAGGTKSAPNNGWWLSKPEVQLKRTGGIIIEGVQYCSMRAAARHYNVSYNTIRYWRDNNRLDIGRVNKPRDKPPKPV